MPKAKIQQIRTAAHDPDRLADFYCTVFGMNVVSKLPDEGVSLTDGHVNLSILKAGVKGERLRTEGLQGFGFLVGDLEEIEDLAPKFGAIAGPVRRQGSVEESEAELLDPIGIRIELSERGFRVDGGTKQLSSPTDPWAERAETKPRIQHVATGPYDQEPMVNFYCNVLGMQEVYRRGPHLEDNNKPGGIFITDGRINFAINVPSVHRGELVRPGFSHIGFSVEDSEEIYRRALEAGALGAFPTPSGVYAEGHILDPIGVRVDVAQEGFAIRPPEDITAFQGHDERVGRVVTSFDSSSDEERQRIVSAFKKS
jgi:catechol 2,3-dioxygenase-like lactoylglutathione lyase family enzyme